MASEHWQQTTARSRGFLAYPVESALRQKLHFVQVLRAVAAMLVVADHVILYLSTKQEIAESLRNLAWFMGAFGVYIFFVISGFIMIYTSGKLFGTHRGPIDFASRRIARIVPMYWIATAVAALLIIKYKVPTATEIASSFLFLPIVTEPGQPLRPLLGVGWTLNLEMFFYAIFTVSLFFSRKVGIFILISTLVVLVAIGNSFKPLTDTTDPLTTLSFLTNPIMLLFAAGVLIGTSLSKFRNFQGLPFAGLASLILIAATISVYALGLNQSPLSLNWQLAAYASSILVVFLAIIESDDSKFLPLNVMELLGNASYSIYLFHYLIIAAFGRAWISLIGGYQGVVFSVLAFSVAVLGGVLIHLWIERRIIALARGAHVSRGTKTHPVSSGASTGANNS